MLTPPAEIDAYSSNCKSSGVAHLSFSFIFLVFSTKSSMMCQDLCDNMPMVGSFLRARYNPHCTVMRRDARAGYNSHVPLKIRCRRRHSGKADAIQRGDKSAVSSVICRIHQV